MRWGQENWWENKLSCQFSQYASQLNQLIISSVCLKACVWQRYQFICFALSELRSSPVQSLLCIDCSVRWFYLLFSCPLISTYIYIVSEIMCYLASFQLLMYILKSGIWSSFQQPDIWTIWTSSRQSPTRCLSRLSLNTAILLINVLWKTTADPWKV